MRAYRDDGVDPRAREAVEAFGFLLIAITAILIAHGLYRAFTATPEPATSPAQVEDAS